MPVTMKNWAELHILACVLIGIPAVSGQTIPEVNIPLGRIVGNTDTVTWKNVQYTVKEFLGIPFAKPPVGELRFRNPETVEDLGSNPYDASYYRPYCTHMFPGQDPYSDTGTEDEDCLYLNVFVPDIQPDSSAGHAVMVWVYGGGFISGATNDYHGSIFAAAGNVIMVTISYRIGAFGFMTTMDSNAPGNYGLFDQAMAIEWVHNNIAAFGGDANRVTIFGESAGAMSVCMQGLYEGNYGKIHRVISQSGTADSPSVDYTKDGLATSKFFAEKFNCPVDDNDKLIDCLRQIPWQQFKDRVNELGADPANHKHLQFWPTIDGAFINGDQRNLSQLLESSERGKVEFFRSLDLLVGFNAYEGGMVAFELSGSDPNFKQFRPTQEEFEYRLIDQLMAAGLFMEKYSPTESFRKSIVHEYTNWSSPYSPESVRVQYIKLIGDYVFAAPAVETARIHAVDGNMKHTYMYHFSPALSIRIPGTPSWLPGADHAEELIVIFGTYQEYLQTEEQRLAERMIDYWANFAKTGNPNSPIDVLNNWPKYNLTHQVYMELDVATGSDPVKQYLAARETDFWTNVMPHFADKGGHTPGDCYGVNGVATLLPTLGALLVCVATTALM